MKVKCHTELSEVSPRKTIKKRVREDSVVGPSKKRQKTGDRPRTWSSGKEGPEATKTAIAEWGEKIVDSISRLRDQVSELNQTFQEGVVVQRGILGQLQKLVWMEDRMRTSLHLLNWNFQTFVDSDQGLIVGVVGDQQGGTVNKLDKGKGKEVIENENGGDKE